MAETDQMTIASGVPSIELMENAGKAVFNNIPIKNIDRVLLLIGPGNNGGDGFVVARLLIEIGISVDIFFYNNGKISNDCKINKDKIDSQSFISEIRNYSSYSYVIDALFGTGFTWKIPSQLEKIFSIVKKNKIPVYAIDLT